MALTGGWYQILMKSTLICSLRVSAALLSPFQETLCSKKPKYPADKCSLQHPELPVTKQCFWFRLRRSARRPRRPSRWTQTLQRIPPPHGEGAQIGAEAGAFKLALGAPMGDKEGTIRPG